MPFRFDQIRKHQPHLAKHRWQNIFWYGAKAAQTGWLCGGKPLIKHAIQIKVILRASSRHATPFLCRLEGCCGALVHIMQRQTIALSLTGKEKWRQSSEPLMCSSERSWPVFRHEAVHLCGARQATTDWFSAALQIRASKDGAWQDMHVPKDVRALVVLNFQSYSGGKDIWGLHDHRWPDEKAKGLKKPIFDDNCIEVSLHHSLCPHSLSPHSLSLTVTSLTIPLQFVVCLQTAHTLSS